MKTTLSKLVLAMGLAVGAPLSALAQSAGAFTLNWSTIDGGGGGASAGGSFLLNGTLGQPDAGAMSGGRFAISGGFQPGVATPPAGTPSILSIRRGAGNTVVLTWPNPSTGYVLQQTPNMNGPGGGWANVTTAPVVVGPNKEVTLPSTGHNCLFRLGH